MRTGSLINLLVGNEDNPMPEVGMGATILMWTDREPVTVIAVNNSRTAVIVQEDRAIRTDSNGLSEVQTYRYEPNTSGRVYTFTLRKNGAWVRKAESKEQGTRLKLGFKEKYRDPSF